MMKITPRRFVVAMIAIVAIQAGCQVLFPFVPDRISRLFFDESRGAVGQGLFTAIQVDPSSEDSAGPQLVATGDLDGDGLIDLASVWNESKPLQLHFQRRNEFGSISFETITLIGDFPLTIGAGIEIADLDDDGRNDVVLLIKENGFFARCRQSGETLGGADIPSGIIVVYFAPEPENAVNALAWEEVPLTQSETAGNPPALPDTPETGGYTSMVLGDIDRQNGLDIVVAWNANDCEGGGNRVEFYTNPGPGTARQSSGWGPFMVASDNPEIKWVDLTDVDRDGDLDIIATYPTSRANNIRWFRNPAVDIPDVFHLSDGTWQEGSIAQIRTGADVIDVADIDGDGISDVVMRSTEGRLIQWLKGPPNPTTAPIRNVPWQVFTLAEFTTRIPQAITMADIDNDGELELVASAEGAILWFKRFPNATVFDHWQENIIIDDVGMTTVTDPNVDTSEVTTATTIINEVEVVDLDGDGRNDIIAGLDRRDLSSLTNDALIWFRNNGLR